MIPFSIWFPMALMGLTALSQAAPLEYYASKYDHLDVETILNNRRMVNHYAACLVNRGPCPPEGMEFKRILPEALRTNCLRCTEKQKTVTYRAIRRLKKEYPKVWADLEALWDPDHVYVAKFEQTYGRNTNAASPSSPSVQIVNRFADNDDNQNTIQPLPSPTSTTILTTSRTTTSTTTSTPSVVKSSLSPATTVKITTQILQSSTHNINQIPVASTKPPPIIPGRPSIGAGIQATVSLGTNIVGELVRGLGALGTRVVETGAEIAGVVLKNIAKPL